MANKMERPPVPCTHLLNLVYSFRTTKVLIQAVKLKLFDKLGDAKEPVEVTTLADNMQLNAVVLERFMNACTSMGLLVRSETDSKVFFQNSEDAKVYLTKKSPHSLLKMFPYIAAFEIPNYRLEKVLKTGKKVPCQELQLKASNSDDSVWSAMYGTEEISESLNDILEAMAQTCLHLFPGLEVSMYKQCVDLGGGLGLHSRTMKGLHPDMKVTLADLKLVINKAKKQEQNKNAGIDYAICDVFKPETLPKADLYVLGHFLHLWTNEQCSQIMRNVYESLNPGGCIVILEKILSHNKHGNILQNGLDLIMMMLFEGMERTEEEFRKLLEEQAFQNFKAEQYDDSPFYDVIYAYKN